MNLCEDKVLSFNDKVSGFQGTNPPSPNTVSGLLVDNQDLFVYNLLFSQQGNDLLDPKGPVDPAIFEEELTRLAGMTNSSTVSTNQQQNLKSLLPWMSLEMSTPLSGLPASGKSDPKNDPLLCGDFVSDSDILHCLDVSIFEEFDRSSIPVFPANSIAKIPGTQVVGADGVSKNGLGKRCIIPGCMKAAQTKGKCKGHGGGNRCKFPNCPKSSQTGGLCRVHGGGKKCSVEGCEKGAQRDSLCATHGGIRKCSLPGCTKNDRGGGFCAQHGGGKRCSFEGCLRPSRKKGLCTYHVRTTALPQVV